MKYPLHGKTLIAAIVFAVSMLISANYALAFGDPVTAAAASNAVSGSKAVGVGTGGKSRSSAQGGGGTATSGGNDQSSKSYGGAVAFPQPVQPVECFYGVSGFWNGFSFTSYSTSCGQDANLRSVTRALPEGSPILDAIAKAVLCASDAGYHAPMCPGFDVGTSPADKRQDP